MAPEFIADEWMRLCLTTYQKHLLELRRNHAGKSVAIAGEKIVEVGATTYLLDKYTRPYSLNVEFFYVPKDDTSLELVTVRPYQHLLE